MQSSANLQSGIASQHLICPSIAICLIIESVISRLFSSYMDESQGENIFMDFIEKL
jgi:ABC-type dipeptide/oligopeptide/nickel transport system permease component